MLAAAEYQVSSLAIDRFCAPGAACIVPLMTPALASTRGVSELYCTTGCGRAHPWAPSSVTILNPLSFSKLLVFATRVTLCDSLADGLVQQPSVPEA